MMTTKHMLGFLLLFTIAGSSIAVPEGGTIRGAKQHDRTQESRRLFFWASINAAAERKFQKSFKAFSNQVASWTLPEEEEPEEEEVSYYDREYTNDEENRRQKFFCVSFKLNLDFDNRSDPDFINPVECETAMGRWTYLQHSVGTGGSDFGNLQY
mmetsp:Transcript_41169/g.47483  ORF Transcript_41169/g.47483 Transcript_41169/m.47483 type:complete len:155 (-) Transcript_41169:257-721(-)